MIRVHLKTPLNGSTGYGRDGIGLSRALARANVELSLQPISVTPPIPVDVAGMLTVEPKPPYDLLLHHLPPDTLGLTQYEKEQSYRQFAWSMWEYENFHASLVDTVAPRLTGYSKLLAYDETSVKAFEALGTDTPIDRLQGGYEPAPWMLDDETPCRDWHSDPFVFVIAGDLHHRKNPYAAMAAVQRLADEGHPVELRLKARHERNIPPGVTERYPCVKVFTGLWSDQQMRDFYAMAHCYVAPSWGEGKNLPALEAGTTGCALVLSDCGGHRAWAMPTFAQLVGGKMNTYDAAFLQVDADGLYEACKSLVTDRQKARQMGVQAANTLPVTMSWDRVVRDLITQHMTTRSAA